MIGPSADTVEPLSGAVAGATLGATSTISGACDSDAAIVASGRTTVITFEGATGTVTEDDALSPETVTFAVPAIAAATAPTPAPAPPAPPAPAVTSALPGPPPTSLPLTVQPPPSLHSTAVPFTTSSAWERGWEPFGGTSATGNGTAAALALGVV